MDLNESPMAVVARHQKSPPIDLNAISRDLGISVFFQPLGAGIAGQLVRDGRIGGASGFSIIVNSLEPINRQRFTFAHEIAHFILHRDLIESGIIDDTMYRSQLSSVYEVQANRLAADILMPIRLVKAMRGVSRDPKQLASMFQVSVEAMKIRLNGIDTGSVNRA